MKKIFITNLGKSQKITGGRYRKVIYKFPDNTEKESQLFGFSLLEWITENNRKPDKMVVLGTSTSMWDALMEFSTVDKSLSDDDMNFYSLLSEEIKDGISDASLKRLSQILSSSLNIETVCKVIPYGVTQQEQHDILTAISDEVPIESEVIFDFTHGLRHLPFFSLLSAFHLKLCKKSEVTAIYYGALELSNAFNEKAPVIEMSFALELMNWYQALTVAENRGTFSAIADMPGVPQSLAETLKGVSFMKATNQIHQMKKYASEALTELNKNGILPPAGELYKHNIISSLEVLNERHFAMRQLNIAKQALEKNNYLQAVSMAFEALISARIEKEPTDYKYRKAADKELKTSSNKTYNVLSTLRNSIMHGTRPDGKVHYKDKNKKTPVQKVMRMLGDENVLINEMGKFIKNIRESIIAKKED